MRTSLTIGLGILVLAVMLTGCTSRQKEEGAQTMEQVQETNQSYQDITGQELQNLMSAQDKIVIVDVRQPEEYNGGHLRNAMLIPLGELANRLGEIDKSKTVVVVCASGARSAQAAGYLVSQGFPNVKNLVGGMYNWQGQIVKGGNK